jgi:hypothetical protein
MPFGDTENTKKQSGKSVPQSKMSVIDLQKRAAKNEENTVRTIFDRPSDTILLATPNPLVQTTVRHALTPRPHSFGRASASCRLFAALNVWISLL